ncbi:MAG: FliA/WhiG family RNA polymerase sigma factor [Lachnospiraceae bacterium]|nr:FliA/WhiG family RNA polymerase sigma factor [Lachnospiraceae bacterium]
MDEAEKNKLWETYSKTKDNSVKEKLIIEYAPLVKFVAGRLSMYLGYTVEFDDLVGYGIFGLIDAIDKFDYEKGIKFETYASLRIRGSILDQIRKMDWIPRSVRQKQKKIDAAMSSLEAKLNRPATEEELAGFLELSVDELLQWLEQTNISNIASLEEFVEQGTEVGIDDSRRRKSDMPESAYEEKELKDILIKALDGLTEKERKVVELYYYEELTLKEISMVLEVSESRISQLHTRAIQKLKEKLGDNIAIFMG